MPMAPPNSIAVSLSAEAEPDCSWGAALTTRFELIALTGAMPTANTVFPRTTTASECRPTAYTITATPTAPNVKPRPSAYGGRSSLSAGDVNSDPTTNPTPA